MAKNLLNEKEVVYEERDITASPAFQKDLEVKNRKTVPQIIIDDHWIGGYDDISALDKEGKFISRRIRSIQ